MASHSYSQQSDEKKNNHTSSNRTSKGSNKHFNSLLDLHLTLPFNTLNPKTLYFANTPTHYSTFTSLYHSILDLFTLPKHSNSLLNLHFTLPFNTRSPYSTSTFQYSTSLLDATHIRYQLYSTCVHTCRMGVTDAESPMARANWGGRGEGEREGKREGKREGGGERESERASARDTFDADGQLPHDLGVADAPVEHDACSKRVNTSLLRMSMGLFCILQGSVIALNSAQWRSGVPYLPSRFGCLPRRSCLQAWRSASSPLHPPPAPGPRPSPQRLS